MDFEEKHYRNVAALPCARCGIENYSQAAHSNLGRHGKGGALKADYRATFPLCCVHPGPDGRLVNGCHIEHDQYIGMTYEEGEERTAKYLAWTEEQLRARGQWPELPAEPVVKLSKLARKPVTQKPARKAAKAKPAKVETERTKNKSRWPVGAGRGFPTKHQSKEEMQSRIVPEKTSPKGAKAAYVWPKRKLESANRLGGRK